MLAVLKVLGQEQGKGAAVSFQVWVLVVGCLLPTLSMPPFFHLKACFAGFIGSTGVWLLLSVASAFPPCGQRLRKKEGRGVGLLTWLNLESRSALSDLPSLVLFSICSPVACAPLSEVLRDGVTCPLAKEYVSWDLNPGLALSPSHNLLK